MAQQTLNVGSNANDGTGDTLRSAMQKVNTMFTEPLVDSTRGGPGGGGAVLTETGRKVLEHYRAFEKDAAKAGAGRINALRAMLRDISTRK